MNHPQVMHGHYRSVGSPTTACMRRSALYRTNVVLSPVGAPLGGPAAVGCRMDNTGGETSGIQGDTGRRMVDTGETPLARRGSFHPKKRNRLTHHS